MPVSFNQAAAPATGQMPPPISTTPDKRPSNLLWCGLRNQARPRPAAIAQPESNTAAISNEVIDITTI